MEAATLNCPMCGASVRSDQPRCEHCGARLATVACPSCFGLMFVGEKFCPHCGAAAARATASEKESRSCPRCRVNLSAVTVGNTQLHECSKCEGIWLDAAAFEQICEDREKQATVLGAVNELPHQPTATFEKQIRYLPCPVCRQLMNRVNFANCSHVIVDVCKAHGTWFDRNELRRIVEFIRAGGMQEAHAREVAELEEKKRRLDAQLETSRNMGTLCSYDHPTTGWCAGLSAAEGLFGLFSRR